MKTVDVELLDRVLEGEASDEDKAALSEWVRVPANLDEFARRAELHADLRRSLRRRHIQNVALEASPNDRRNERIRKKNRGAISLARSRRDLVLTIAGVATAACLLLLFLWQESQKGVNRMDSYAASIVSRVNGVLARGDQTWDEARIPAGSYALNEGLLHLQFGGGVMVYVEAPARFDAVSDKRIVLHNGRLSARVPPEGIGFTVETPEAEVVDFGTEFSVDVEDGTSEVHVFDGLVHVHPGASDRRDVSRSVELQASQAVRITDGASAPVDISVASDRFIRNFDEPRLNYARVVKQLSPLAYYRMPIRDRGLVSEPPDFSGVVLTGEGKRPPHGRGVFVGGSLRVGADSTGRGGRVDSPPALIQENFALSVFVYLEAPSHPAVVATNMHNGHGNFELALEDDGNLRATIRDRDGAICSVPGAASLPLKTWRHVVVTTDGEQLRFYEDGEVVAAQACEGMADSESDTIWFGTDPVGIQVWDGRIDEVALFDHTLTSENVSMLHRIAEEEIARLR